MLLVKYAVCHPVVGWSVGCVAVLFAQCCALWVCICRWSMSASGSDGPLPAAFVGLIMPFFCLLEYPVIFRISSGPDAQGQQRIVLAPSHPGGQEGLRREGESQAYKPARPLLPLSAQPEPASRLVNWGCSQQGCSLKGAGSIYSCVAWSHCSRPSVVWGSGCTDGRI